MLKFVPSVIRSIQDSRRLRQPVDVLISSIVNMVSTNKNVKSGLRLENLTLFYYVQARAEEMNKLYGKRYGVGLGGRHGGET
jgi:hypothetical protein